jgi:hypothetical protein
MVFNKVSAIWGDGEGTTDVKDDFDNIPRIAARDKIGDEIGIKAGALQT